MYFKFKLTVYSRYEFVIRYYQYVHFMFIQINTLKQTYWLWLMLRTSKFFAFSSPSGISFKRLWDKSKVVSSSKQKSSFGIPELLMQLFRKFSVRRHASSVNSPYNFSNLLFFNDRCSSFINLPISSGISWIFVLSKFNHCTPVMCRSADGNLPS